jgi:acylphosphatase
LADAGEPTQVSADQVTRRFLVTGKVQGVYFRHSTRMEAERLGIRGVARNLPDGSVEVIARGPRAAIEKLHEWLRRGPPMARVAAVQELEPPHGIELGQAPGTGDEGRTATSFLVE